MTNYPWGFQEVRMFLNKWMCIGQKKEKKAKSVHQKVIFYISPYLKVSKLAFFYQLCNRSQHLSYIYIDYKYIRTTHSTALSRAHSTYFTLFPKISQQKKIHSSYTFLVVFKGFLIGFILRRSPKENKSNSVSQRPFVWDLTSANHRHKPDTSWYWIWSDL